MFTVACAGTPISCSTTAPSSSPASMPESSTTPVAPMARSASAWGGFFARAKIGTEVPKAARRFETDWRARSASEVEMTTARGLVTPAARITSAREASLRGTRGGQAVGAAAPSASAATGGAAGETGGRRGWVWGDRKSVV